MLAVRPQPVRRNGAAPRICQQAVAPPQPATGGRLRLCGVVGVERGPERVDGGHADSASSLTKHLRDRRPVGRFHQPISTVYSIAPDASALYHADIRAGRKIRARQEGGGSLRHFSIWSPISSYDAVDIRHVYPVDYRLFQAADFLCTMELLELKRVNRDLSPNDLRFFNGTKEFTKTYFKKMREKRFAG